MDEKPTYQQELDKRLKKWVEVNRMRISFAIVAVVIGHLLLYLFFAVGSGKTFADENITLILAGVILVDLISAVFSYVYLAYHKISEEIYNDQANENSKLQVEIQRLEDKWETSAVPLKLIVTALRNRSESKKRVSIKIENPTPNKISNLKIELMNLINNPFFTNERSYSVLDEVSYSNRSFHEIDRLNKDGGIDGLDYVIVHLGKVVENNLVVLLKENITNHSYWEINEEESSTQKAQEVEPRYRGWMSFNARYDVELVIKGEIDGRPLEPQSFIARIEFREIIRYWEERNKQWVRLGDTGDIYTRIDIAEVRYEEAGE